MRRREKNVLDGAHNTVQLSEAKNQTTSCSL